MIRKNKVALLILLILLMGCGSSKKATEVESLPGWVKEKPMIPGYYVGLGSAQRTPNTTDYQVTAKNKALADLVSEISVNISTQSVLNRFESDKGFAEDFVSLTKSYANENIEGYEVVNTYESPTHYYVLYKLSIEKYKSIKEQRKQVAVAKGLDLIKKAGQLIGSKKYYDAIFNLTKGLEVVLPYLSESLECELNGKTIDLGNELYNGLITTMNNIIISPKANEIEVTKGQSIPLGQLVFTFKTADGVPLQGIPVIFSLGSKPLHNNKCETNILGEASYELQPVNTTKSTGYLIAQMDANEVASFCASDPLIRKLIRKMDMPSARILIRLKDPKFFVESSELNFNVAMNPKILKGKMEQLLANNGFPVVYSKPDADFTINISSNTNQQKVEGKMFYAILNAEIKVLNTNGELVFSRPVVNITGVQLNLNDAGLDAYNNLSDYLTKNFMPKLKDVLYQ